MSGQKVIYNRLINTSAVTAIVGKRIRPFKSAQRDANPRIVYQQVGGEGDYSNDGDTELSIQRWQLDAFADSYPDLCELVAEILKASKSNGALSGYRGSTNTGGVTVQAIYFTGDTAVDEGVIDGTDSKEWRHSFDLEIWLEK